MSISPNIDLHAVVHDTIDRQNGVGHDDNRLGGVVEHCVVLALRYESWGIDPMGREPIRAGHLEAFLVAVVSRWMLDIEDRFGDPVSNTRELVLDQECIAAEKSASSTTILHCPHRCPELSRLSNRRRNATEVWSLRAPETVIVVAGAVTEFSASAGVVLCLQAKSRP